jgi:hypothetical protein
MMAGTWQTEKRRVLIRMYGDSLSMPRIRAGIPYTHSYGELFRSRLEEFLPGIRVDLYNRSVGGASIARLKETFEIDDTYFGPGEDILIIQAGIVDCAPRSISGRARRLVGRCPSSLAGASSAVCITTGRVSLDVGSSAGSQTQVYSRNGTANG